ncbi:membrane protein [Salinisphaera shabanensis E1L3A]|uniref:Membrane protein n=1 Tax=Salinisphaera shabanensis E1L3A TaxID=1033802 RepID=U2EPK9_9GAMM|nr:DMT family transporter [Salinisphaera shabanensis]ERJ19745.1 membrane protein [Salinisphaera shabanensis E1L3A]
MSGRLYGILITGLGVLILSPDSILIRLLDADMATTLFWRGTALVMGLGLYLFWRERGDSKPIIDALRSPLGWGLGVLFALSNVLFVFTIEHTTIADTLGCLATASIFAALFSVVFLHERAPLRTWLTAAAIAAGLLLIAFGGAGSLIGRVAGIATAMVFGATFVIMRATGQGDTLPGLALGGLIMALVTVFFATPFSLTTPGMAALAGLAVVLPLAFALIGRGPRYLAAPEVSLLMLLETVFGTLWASVFLGEIPTRATLAAIAIILGVLGVFYWRQAIVHARDARHSQQVKT